jgi:hypothetical protein
MHPHLSRMSGPKDLIVHFRYRVVAELLRRIHSQTGPGDNAATAAALRGIDAAVQGTDAAVAVLLPRQV